MQLKEAYAQQEADNKYSPSQGGHLLSRQHHRVGIFGAKTRVRGWVGERPQGGSICVAIGQNLEGLHWLSPSFYFTHAHDAFVVAIATVLVHSAEEEGGKQGC
jgi:hypothetical protein